jgi:plasmid stability protein
MVVANLTVKDLPDSVYRQLKEAAQAEGRSLNGYVIALLKSSTDERTRRKLMREGRDDFRRFLSSLTPMDDSTQLIREDRDSAH